MVAVAYPFLATNSIAVAVGRASTEGAVVAGILIKAIALPVVQASSVKDRGAVVRAGDFLLAALTLVARVA